MKIDFEIRNTYEEAIDVISNCKKPMYVLNGDDGEFWIVDLSRASKLIKQGYKIANKEANTSGTETTEDS